jgi:hypothetical protein
MKTSGLEAGTTYLDNYGNEFIYLGQWAGTVDTMGYRAMHKRKATKSDILVLRYRAGTAMGRSLNSGAEYKVKGGTWSEEVIHASNVKQALGDFVTKKEHDDRVYELFQIEAKRIAERLRSLGIEVGEMDIWGEGYDKISVPSAPLLDSDYSGTQVFDLRRLVIHLDGEDLARLLTR